MEATKAPKWPLQEQGGAAVVLGSWGLYMPVRTAPRRREAARCKGSGGCENKHPNLPAPWAPDTAGQEEEVLPAS